MLRISGFFAPVASCMKKILDIQDADDIVAVVLDHRNPRKSRTDYCFQGQLLVDLDDEHVGPRSHDLRCAGVVELENVADQLFLFLLDLAFLLDHFHDGDQLLFGHGRTILHLARQKRNEVENFYKRKKNDGKPVDGNNHDASDHDVVAGWRWDFGTISPNTRISIVITPVAMLTALDSNMVRAMDVAMAEDPTLTRLLPIRIVERSFVGIVFHFLDQLVGFSGPLGDMLGFNLADRKKRRFRRRKKARQKQQEQKEHDLQCHRSPP